MPRKRSKSPKHKTRPRSKSKKTKSRSKSKNRKYGGNSTLWSNLIPANDTRFTDKYGVPEKIFIQEWITDGNYNHPSYFKDNWIILRKATLYNVLPSYVESVSLTREGKQTGYTITKQWRVGSVSNFKFRTTNKIPEDKIIGLDLEHETYYDDLPCFIFYDISKKRNNNNRSMLFKVYKLVNKEGIETFYIYVINNTMNIISVPIKINGHDKFLAEIEKAITENIDFMKKNNDLMYYNTPST